MATEKPIVSSAVADVVTNFSSVVNIARTHEQFISLCREAIGKPDTERIEAGFKQASENSWDSIVAKLEKHVADALAKQQTSEALA